MSQSNSNRIYRATTDSDVLDLPRASLTSGMTMFFVPVLSGMTALTGGGPTNLDGISTLELAVPTVFDVLGDSTMSRWLLRARQTGEVTTTGADAAKVLVQPVDDDSLIWALVFGPSAAGGAVAGWVDGSGNRLVDGSGNPITSP